MLAVLPLIALIFLWLICESSQNNWRISLLSSLVIWGVILTGITEILSLFKLLKFEWLMVLWLSIDLIAIAGYWQFYRKRGKSAVENKQGKSNNLFNLPLSLWILIGGIALVVAIVGLVAIVAPPNHSDSMEYHMSRVVHWMQNASVAHYPTHTLFQLFQNPWSEFAISHFQILSGGDRFANLIQWGSMIGSIIGVSLIANQLGGNTRSQIFAAVFCATIPMGILQASSTNNDYVVALWLVCFAYFTLLTVKEGATLANTSRLAASLGLAILTKGTAYIYAFPFCIWLAIWGIAKLKWKVWQPILVVAIIFLAINLGHYTRNFTLFGSPLGLSEGETNKYLSLGTFISGVTRNLALHADIVRNLGLENILPSTNGITEKIIRIIHGLIGLDVSDPRLTSPKVSKFYVPGLSRYEDTAGNPLHLLVILGACIFCIFNRRLRQQPYLILYWIAASSSFFLFCFLFTWSPWRCRLHLPIFILLSAFVGVILSKALNYRISYSLAVILLLLSHPWVLHNDTRPIITSHNIFNTPRIEQYFKTQQKLQKPYIEAVNVVKSSNCSKIGLILDRISFEYPIWMLFPHFRGNAIIRHVDVTNESARLAEELPNSSFNPCAIVKISRNNSSNLEKDVVTKTGNYHEYWSTELIQVFLPK
ncbi:MAG TPA: hypothetical protein DEG17_13600 [Cyanobacteria bacterium UBA11149]|nr:hypothetical protein [Cyanobacteria bacterium UBA11367]HBE58064.1 hypothetical protein [Cyanobacteria bacterium UBA11366]HBK63540.1 hypothetical protein [Cyanobacteria bacterium UBA11166]HBR74959.1 hypothetical protein [Cyanobacteria bacterium UBA11159]HBS71505.1 hypothetical protein [Cyanobacteria bacterium UBA11153]HBW89877.1 hypothetical protein [Cyanobacteria bacterium UBA11149]HCA94821.1 hypothetical protein [Cyanobacteria bacterium UBA9226]